MTCLDTDPCPNCGAVIEATYEAWGEHLGYPPCCTLEFIDWARAHDMVTQLAGSAGNFIWASNHPRRDRLLSGSGFIPCGWHTLANTEEELIQIIDNERQCTLSFAEDWRLLLEEAWARAQEMDEEETV